jgi:hypothetical protein
MKWWGNETCISKNERFIDILKADHDHIITPLKYHKMKPWSHKLLQWCRLLWLLHLIENAVYDLQCITHHGIINDNTVNWEWVRCTRWGIVWSIKHNICKIPDAGQLSSSWCECYIGNIVRYYATLKKWSWNAQNLKSKRRNDSQVTGLSIAENMKIKRQSKYIHKSMQPTEGITGKYYSFRSTRSPAYP